MIYEYALEPAVLDNWNDFSNLYKEFGVEKGRLISEFPAKWKRMVYKVIENSISIQPIQRVNIVEKLSLIGDKMIPNCKRIYNPEKEWLINADEQHQTKPFHAIIAKNNYSDKKDIKYIIESDYINDHPLWEIEKSKKINRTTQELWKVIEPLIKISEEILFIDPHFTPTADRYINSFKFFILSIIKQCRQFKRIEIHVKKGNKPDEASFNPDSFTTLCESFFANLMPENIEVNLFIWKKKDFEEDLHPRLVLSEKGGINIEKGLDISLKENDKTLVHLLDNKPYNDCWRDYQPLSTPFSLIKTVRIQGKKKIKETEDNGRR